MSDAGESSDCRNCGHSISGEDADRNGWCKACRAVLVRRSAMWAVLPALVVVGLYLWMLGYFGMFKSTLVIVWIALGAALAYVTFKVARRVLFDVIRSRGVKPPTADAA
ncbi:MAG TPA: hypothetical protein VF541_16540 [Longimicrobium sp.]